MSNALTYFIRLYFLAIIFIFLCLACIASLISGVEVLGAVVVHLMFTAPFLLLITCRNSFTVALYICIATTASVVTLIAFYLTPEHYYFNEHRPFGFGALSAFKVSGLLGLFFLLLIALDSLIGAFNIFPMKRSPRRQNGSLYAVNREVSSPNYSKKSAPIILLLLTLTLVIKPWMFSNGVGLVGIEPPKLPFKMSGALFYLFNWIVPWSIALLYTRSRRSLGVFLFVVIVGIISGICSLSKAVLLFFMLGPIFYSLYDRHWYRFVFSIIACSVGLAAVLSARSILYLIVDGEVFLNLTHQISTFAPLLMTELKFSYETFFVLVSVMDRVDGFQSLHLSSNFDSSAVGGGWQLFLRFLYSPWSEINIDAMHVEFMGFSLPSGFISVTGTITSQMLMTSNSNIYWLGLFAVAVVIFSRLVEYACKLIAIKYNMPSSIKFGILFGFSMFYYLSPGVPSVYIGLAILIFLAFSPRFVLRKSIERPPQNVTVSFV